MAIFKDPYKILGVSSTATQDEIKNAYRGLAKKYHPDLNPGNKEAENKFKAIGAAYEQIGTPEMRAKYDRGETPEQMEEAAREYESKKHGGPFYYDTQQAGGRYSNFSASADAEDFFENLFRNSQEFRHKGRSSSSMDFPGEDELYHMEVDFITAARGGQREISLPNGKKLQINIPAGVETGSKLRFRGQGQPGSGKGLPGDAFVEILVQPKVGFKRNGLQIETEIEVSFIEALLGADVEIPTLDGPVLMKVPPGVTTGSRLRIRERGIHSATGKKGDQIVFIRISMPKQLNPDLQAAVRAWNGKFSYNPRTEK